MRKALKLFCEVKIMRKRRRNNCDLEHYYGIFFNSIIKKKSKKSPPFHMKLYFIIRECFNKGWYVVYESSTSPSDAKHTHTPTRHHTDQMFFMNKHIPFFACYTGFKTFFHIINIIVLLTLSSSKAKKKIERRKKC